MYTVHNLIHNTTKKHRGIYTMSAAQKTDDRKFLNIPMDESLHTLLKEKSAKEERSMQAQARLILKKSLAQQAA